jgi:Transmembrane protein 18
MGTTLLTPPWRDHAAALASAATWLYHASRRDPWLIALAASHTSLLTLVIAARDSQPLQLAVLAACFGVVRGGDAINRALARRSRSFASRDFFDARGAFFAAAVAGPLLGVMCVQLVSRSVCVLWG